MSSPRIKSLTAAFTVCALIISSGCSSTPSKPAKGAMTGAAAGAVAGAVIGNNTGSGNQAGGAAIGGAAGAVIGGVVGMVQEARERSEQDRLAQERAYQQELAKRRASEAKFKAQMEEELAAAEGFRISDQELNQVESSAKDAEAKLKKLQEEKQAARKRSLDTAENRVTAAEAEIQRLEAELAELRGDTAQTTNSFIEHQVERGEDLTAIATRYNLTPDQVRSANTGVNVDRLEPGQKLRIPVKAAAAAVGTAST
jgi:LysM repeat protein